MTLLSYLTSTDVAAVIIGILVSVIAYYKWSFTYWKRKGLEVPFQPVIPFGHLTEAFSKKCTFSEQIKICYDKLRAAGLRHGGIYLMASPSYVVTDPELIKNIMLKDFQHFVNHGSYINEKSDPLGDHLFAQEDEKWRYWRVKMSPTFTSGKMKMMFQTMVDTTPTLVEILDDYANKRSSFDIKELFARFTTDIIATCAFGIRCNSLKNPESEFRHYGKLGIEEVGVIENMKIFSQFILPHGVLRFFNMAITKTSVTKFFLDVVKETVQYREANNVFRKDFMHLLLQLKNRGKVTDDDNITDEEGIKNNISLNELAAQCWVFFIAGFETSSTASTFALYELAKNQKVQQKVRDEVNKVLEKHDGKVTYDAVMEMSYLEKVVQESLRKYPPVPFLFRVCNKTYKVPGSDVIIDKGTRVLIPILGLQRDPEYFPNPDVFDPDRFNEEEKSKRHPFTWIPFGEGPRVCIGLRFGMLQAKLGLATILQKHKISLNEKTKEPMKMKNTGLILTAEGGIWLNIENIKQ